MKKLSKYMLTIITIIILLIIPQLQLKPYYMHILIMIGIYIILVQGLNLITGFTGQVSLGHAAFYGVGAYTSALLTTNAGLSFWIAVPIGGIVAGLFGIALGFPALRLKGPYLVIATLGFSEVIRQIALNWTSLTRGPMGITGIPAPEPINLIFTRISFDSKTTYYYLVLVVVVVFMILVNNLANSRTGRAMFAIREDTVAAEVMGVDLAFYKVSAFVMGAFMAGLAGGLYAHYIRFISPDSFQVSESTFMLVMLMVGGAGTLIGPVTGATVIYILLEAMRGLDDYRMIVYGVILFLTIVYVPSGLAGIFKPAFSKLSSLLSRKGDE